LLSEGEQLYARYLRWPIEACSASCRGDAFGGIACGGAWPTLARDDRPVSGRFPAILCPDVSYLEERLYEQSNRAQKQPAASGQRRPNWLYPDHFFASSIRPWRTFIASIGVSIVTSI
jgi:hypothetical protein